MTQVWSQDCRKNHACTPPWIRWTLLTAAAYNLIFGAWAIFWPQRWFELSGMTQLNHPMIWQCLGMVVGVYGVAYAIAALHPVRYWPLILVGFLGKILGPIGFAKAAWFGLIPWKAGWLCVFNDLIWWLPFSLILWHVAKVSIGRPFSRRDPLSITEAADIYRLNDSETLGEASQNRPLVLVFLRHFGCTFARKIILNLNELQNNAQKHGAQLVLVHMLHQGEEASYLSKSKINDSTGIGKISDPHCDLYRAFGLGKATFLELFGPRVWRQGILALLGGCGMGRIAGDGFQLPGAFLFHQGKIVRSQPAKDASDIPDLHQLLDSESS